MMRTLTSGWADDWLSKPFARLIRLWCRATGHSPRHISFASGVAAEATGMIAAYLDRMYLFAGFFLACGAMLIFLGQHHGSPFHSDSDTLPAYAYAYLQASRVSRLAFAAFAALEIGIGAPLFAVMLLLFVLAEYANTTTGRGTGKKLSERVRELLAPLPRLVPATVPSNN